MRELAAVELSMVSGADGSGAAVGAATGSVAGGEAGAELGAVVGGIIGSLAGPEGTAIGDELSDQAIGEVRLERAFARSSGFPDPPPRPRSSPGFHEFNE
jgi:phage tail tape-measure protein